MDIISAPLTPSERGHRTLTKVQPDSVVYTDSFRACVQVDVTDFHHMRINHSKLFADRQNQINGIENFWK